jgi:uncharacterized protein YndB with AHSA1/START domain
VSEKIVTMTRVFSAPPEEVFAAWTQAKHLARWFGPTGFTVPSCEVDPRPGGLFRLCMRSPQGKDYWVRGVYREVVAPERLVITCTAEDDKGIARLEEVINVTLTEQDRKTTLKLHAIASGPSAEAAAMLSGMQKGWSQTVDRLAAVLNPHFTPKR